MLDLNTVIVRNVCVGCQIAMIVLDIPGSLF